MNDSVTNTTRPHRLHLPRVLNHHVLLPSILVTVVVLFMWLAYSQPNKTSPQKAAQLAEQTYTVLDNPRFEDLSETDFSAQWRTLIVKPGDSVASLFKQLNLNQQLVLSLAKHPTAKKLVKQLQAGQTLRVLIDENHTLLKLIYPLNKEKLLIITNTGNEYSAQVYAKDYELRLETHTATIETSFSQAALKAGLTQTQLMTIANLFQDTLNFKRDIHPGDTLNVLYETYWADHQKIKNGRMLGIEIKTKKRIVTALSFTFPDGRQAYFTPTGESLHLSFLKTPVQYKRISSPFNPNRQHPILNVTRPHTGVDLAAPRNTPIYATGTGKIKFIGRRGGYGRAIIINHGKGYTTLYGHMAGFAKNLKESSYVNKGQLIGYVGSSGLATGPHVHYELRINGTPKNPFKVKIPKSDPLPAKYRKHFDEQKNGILQQFAQNIIPK